MIVFSILPILAFVLIYIKLNKNNDWRDVFIKSVLTYSTVVLVITEMLSFFNSLTYLWAIVCWCIVIVTLILIKSNGIYFFIENIKGWKPSKLEVLISIILVIQILTLIMIAFIAPPNTWDAMTYHMSRIEHWIVNRNVEHYPTSTFRQLYISPFAEYLILQFRILTNTDYFSNSIQLFAYFGTAISISKIASTLGYKVRTQFAIVIFFLSMPSAILQATSTQTDLLAAMYVCMTVYFILQNPSNAYWTGIALSIAVLTKSINYIYLFPFCIFYLFKDNIQIKEKFKYSLICIVILIVSNFNFHFRNFKTFGDISGHTKEVSEMKNTEIHPYLIIANIVKFYSMNFSTPSETFNEKLTDVIKKTFIKFNIDVNDNRNSMKIDEKGFAIPRLSVHEDIVANPIHSIIILIAFLLLFISSRTICVFGLCVISGFILLCTVFPWEPWVVRIQLPFLALSTLLFGYIFEKYIFRYNYNILLLCFLLLGMNWVFRNYSKPVISVGAFKDKPKSIFLTPREDMYFSNRPWIKEDFYKIIEVLKNMNCNKIVIQISNDYWEYPLWALTRTDKKINSKEFYTLTDKNVDIYSSICAVIAQSSTNEENKILNINNDIWSLVKHHGTLSIYQKEQ